MKGLLFGDLMPERSLCHCIVYPVHDPDYFFLCRGVIEEVDMTDKYMPCYTVRPAWVYETTGFLVEALHDRWVQAPVRGTVKIEIPKDVRKSPELFNTWLADSGIRFRVEYPLAFPTRVEAVECYKAMKEFSIARMLKKLMWLGGQAMYDGPFSSASKQEYLSRLRRGWSDQFASREEIDRFLSSIHKASKASGRSGAQIPDIGEGNT